jgi:hypothetical protein
VQPLIPMPRTPEAREEKDRVAAQFGLFAGILPNLNVGRTGSRSSYLAYRPAHGFLVHLGKNSPAVTLPGLADHSRCRPRNNSDRDVSKTCFEKTAPHPGQSPRPKPQFALNAARCQEYEAKLSTSAS